MKRIIITVLAIVGIMMSFSSATAGQGKVYPYSPIVISGFGENEFAVKGSIDRQVKACVKKIKADFSAFKYAKLFIAVKGASTRSTGTASANDKVSSRRAENIAAYLQVGFPSAVVKAIALGYAANARQVLVEYAIMENPKAIASKEMEEKFNAAIGDSEQKITQAVKAELKDYSNNLDSSFNSLKDDVKQVADSQKTVSRLVIISGIVLVGLVSLLFIGFYSSRYKHRFGKAMAVDSGAERKALLKGITPEPAIEIFPVLPKKLAGVIAIKRDSNLGDVMYECPFNPSHKCKGRNATRHAKSCSGYQKHFTDHPEDIKTN